MHTAHRFCRVMLHSRREALAPLRHPPPLPAPTRVQHSLQLLPQSNQVGCSAHDHGLSCDGGVCHTLQRVGLAVTRWILAGSPAGRRGGSEAWVGAGQAVWWRGWLQAHDRGKWAQGWW